MKQKIVGNALRLLLVSCVGSATLIGQTSPVLTLSRTNCYGSCPVYDLALFPNGSVQWIGKQFVATLGAATATISKQQIDALIRTIETSGFKNLQSSYRDRDNGDGTRTSISDQPTTHLTVTTQGLTKSVEDYAFAPEELHQLERLVDRASNSHRWIHDQAGILTIESVEPSYHLTLAEDLKNGLVVASDIESQIKPGFTRLMQAAGQGKLPVVKREVEAGSDPNSADETGWTALMMAATEAKPETVVFLLSRGARVDSLDRNGDTALIGAAANPWLYGEPGAQESVVRHLLAAGAAVDHTDRNGESALMWSAKSGSPEVLQLLLNAGADPRRRNSSGHDALFAVQQWLAARSADTRRERFEQTLSGLQKAMP